MKKTHFLSLAEEIIKEQSFDIDNRHKLAGLLKQKDETERINRFTNHTLLFLNIEQPIPLIWISSLVTTYELPRQSFIDILRLLPEINFDSLLFALNFYQNFREHDFNQVLNNKINFKSYGKVFDEILAPSFGYLVYAHQLERIYSILTGAGYSEAIVFRKNWNMKRPSTRTMVSAIKLIDNKSLLDMINDNALDQEHFFCFHALRRSAYNLYTHLLNETSSNLD